MQVRASRPTKGNKYYITRANGGYSTCIQGNPKDSSCDVLSNCVGYACGRFNEIVGSMKYPTLNCNAENFIERAKKLGLSISKIPTLGGIMVWKKGETLSGNDGAGHVEIVEKIIDNNNIYTSASNYGGLAFYNAKRNNSNGRWGLASSYVFRGCIINPLIGNITSKSKTKKKSVTTIAKEVIKGKWDNYPKRKTLLENAGYNYNEVQTKVNEILNKNNKEEVTYYQVPDYTGNSIVDALKEINVDSSFKNRKQIAKVNGITSYKGTSNENSKLLNLLKNGKLKK